jgi:hypothetical protein
MSPFGTVPPSHFPFPLTRPLALVINRVEPPVPFENNETQVFFELTNNTAQEVSGVVSGIQGSYQITALAPHATVSGSLTTIAPAAGKNAVFNLWFDEPPPPGVEFPPHAAEADFEINVAAAYLLRLDSIHISKTRAGFESGETDTVCLAWTTQVGDEPKRTQQLSLGSIGSGEYPLDLQFPFNSIPGVSPNITLSYAAMNTAFASGDQQTEERLRDVLNALSKVSEQVLNAIFPAYSGVWKLGDQLTEWLNSFIVTNCDGLVATDIVVLSSTFLDQATLASRAYRETRRYIGLPSPVLCGDTSEYYITWSVFRYTSGPS